MADFGGKPFKSPFVAGIKDSRFIEPHDCEGLDEWRIKYANAQKLADDVGDIPLGFRAYVILSGRFIFGDFLEALIVKNNWDVIDLTLSTLSMSHSNIDSLSNLTDGGFVRDLSIIVSPHYFAHERNKVIPYCYKHLDKANKFQLAVAAVHTKIAMIRTACGKKIVIHGSANLRTSDNIEQIVIEHSPELYDFNYEIHAAIIEKHKTINKAVRGVDDMWDTVLAAGQEEDKIKAPQTKYGF